MKQIFPSSVLVSRSQLPRALRRASAAAHLLGLRVRIPAGDVSVCLLMSAVCFQVELSGSG